MAFCNSEDKVTSSTSSASQGNTSSYCTTDVNEAIDMCAQNNSNDSANAEQQNSDFYEANCTPDIAIEDNFPLAISPT